MSCLKVKKCVWSGVACLIMLGTLVVTAMAEHPTEHSEKTSPARKEHMSQQQKTTAKMENAECRIPGMAGSLQSADTLMGMTVNSPGGETLGSIEDLILDNSQQAVTYVILSANDNLYPVPWTAFDTGMDTYTLDITSANLRQAPSIVTLDSSQFSTSDLEQKTHDFYADQISAVQNKGVGERAMEWVKEKAGSITGRQEQPQIYRCNQVIGFDVQDMQGNPLGQLEDVVIDVRQGNLAYGLVSFGGVWGIGQKTAVVPWEAVQFQSPQQIAKIAVDKTALRASVLPKGDLWNLTEPAFARQVHQDFNLEPYWEVHGFVAPSGAMGMSTMAWQPDSQYNKNFNTGTVETITATIKKVSTFAPEKDAAPGLKLKVETQDGRTLAVYAGPQQHYLQQKLRFQKGDPVTITGSRTTIEDKSVIMATRIQKGSDTLQIRDSQGRPAWKMEMIDQQQMNQSENKQMPREKESPSMY